MSELEKTTNVVQRIAQPFHVTLTRGQRGGYGFTIEVHGEDRDAVLYEVDQIHDYLKGRYLDGQTRIGSLQPAGLVSAEDPHAKIERAIQNVKAAMEKGPLEG